ncbi:methyltransferase type 12, partial [Acidovorax delafieldii 2AN]
YPEARIHGIEWSCPLRLACALRCPWAQVRRADMWQADWSAYQLVYLFQRPESMARAAAKAQAELAAGAWLVSLEFAVPDMLPWAQMRSPGGRLVWLYRMPFSPAGA